jgi:hypothetical protein
MLDKKYIFQCAFITVHLDRFLIMIKNLTLVMLLNQSKSFLEQTNYLRLLWMFECVSSIKEFTNNFWSSSPNANNSNNAWQLNFNNGNDNNNRNNSYRVRLVRFGA